MAERRAEDGKSSLDYVRGKEEVKAAVSSSPRPDRMPFAPTLGADRRATPDTVETVDTASFRSVRSDRATTPPTASTAPATLSVPGGTNTVPQPSLQPQHEAPRPIPSGVVPSKEEEESHRPGLGPMIKQPEEPHRPGLGPMIKQRSARDVASAFRKAATAYNAFKPRAGGQGSWRQDEDKGEDGAPDGINGVVPAPSLVARASQDHVTTTHTSPSSGTASRPILSRGPSGSAAANATPLSTTSASGETRKPQENAAGKAMAPIEETSKAQEKAAGKAIAPTEETSEETYRATLRASSLSLEAALQAKHDELARPRPARPDPTIHYAEILGIPHSMLCPPPPTANTGSSSGQAGSTTTLSGTELVNILHDIGWVECQKPAAPGPGNNDDDDDEHGNGSKINMRTSTVDELLAELQRQITRTEREGWLAVIDRMNPADVINRHDEQVEELRKLFDVALEQCDAVDDMIALHLAELSTFNEDFNYLVEQSGGLAMEVANSVWLRSELEERIRTQTESERINGIPEGQDRLPEEEEEEQELMEAKDEEDEDEAGKGKGKKGRDR
ncbi:MAG: hypothetical protein M1826_005640 [Phylliscum demangeonii]|nr:MAG: hypothetical protein M1826_005640 [Phylliscum demangeonii]